MGNIGLREVFILCVGGFLSLTLADPISPTFINEYQTAPDTFQRVELFSCPEFFRTGVHNIYLDSIVTNNGKMNLQHLLIDPALPYVQWLDGMIDKNGDTMRIYSWFDADPYYWEEVIRGQNWLPEYASVSLIWYNDVHGIDLTRWYIDFTPTFGEENDGYGFIKGQVKDTNGKPLTGMVIIKGEYDSSTVWSSADWQDGLYVTVLAVGKYYVRAQADSHWTQVYPESVEVKNLDTTGVDFSLAGIEETHNPVSPALPQFSILPFNDNIRILFQLPRPLAAKVTVFDGSGRMVKVLFNGKADNRAHTLYWDRRDRYGKEMPAGLYFVTLEAGKSMITKKLVLVKGG